ncbi:phenylalanyl-tRNA synthetase [Capsaspora owczarzaki ATCC 30864]|uniref:phenylalanine--tRNA ligase n=1 Tax=Capsaspora owczarzaki (strain ATCC 30864) TaxID=595528 RepID=A0A0D2WT87_CAPO3|nr:phenylalanyl-tRNA synthetase [Capsaspora owczarzaki ATCC 30864]KJE94828.1 phenylalanyl-tRNA synthetase [Capsaspora owczarzaki ATCC 30864]|eukprot:XP_004346074.2 phenylalanyl-tRNA synthetase [Capsaspora owczarzaki ATCC 30864]
MPTISVNRSALFAAIGKTYTDTEFDELCFEFGIELDEVTTEVKVDAKAKGQGDKSVKNPGANAKDEEVVYRVEIPANRYDLLCLEGLGRALRVFVQQTAPPKYTLSGKPVHRLVVHKEVAEVRPFVVAAVLRDITFDAAMYQRFIELQDKLHQNICRKRTLVAIGTHDLDTIQGPFAYKALKPEEISFVPLNQTEKHTGASMMKLYEDSHLREFLPIIRDKPRYPVIYDAKNVVLSVPPIINGDHSKISLNTRNVFIECTATDRTKALIVLEIMVTMFSQHCAKPFVIEPVEIVHADGTSEITPKLAYRTETVEVEWITKRVGIKQTPEQVAKLLSRMCLPATVSADGKSVVVDIPPTRSDVIHACDIMEDVAVGYGFNNLEWTVPATSTVAHQLPVNKLTDLLRLEMAMAGFTEVLTFSLCSHAENFSNMRHQDDNSAVVLANPQSVEFQVCRTSLMPGLLKTLHSNLNVPLPMRVFEISDVVLKDTASDTGARNERRLAVLYSNIASQFEIVHGVLDRVMTVLEVPFNVAGGDKGYSLQSSADSMYFPGQAADIFANGRKIGSIGVLHPEVLSAFALPNPVSCLEITIEPFL